MELIPIIYAVLELVVVLTIFTLIVSYIGSRMRQRKGGNVTNNLESAGLLQPIVKIVAPLKSDLEKDEKKPILIPNEARQEKSKDKNKDESQRKHSPKSPAKQKAKPPAEKSRINNERISVLKNLAAQSAQEVKHRKTQSRTGKNQIKALGDDILDKYMEDDDNDMYTLKVKKDQENRENKV